MLFRIERDGNRVWIVPASAGCNIRVNATKIRGPRVITGKAILEFSDIRLHARVIERRNLEESESSPDTETLGWASVDGSERTHLATRVHLPLPAPFRVVSPSEEVTLFDPVSAAVLSSRATRSPRPGPTGPHVSKEPRHWLEAVGGFGRKWPRRAWFAGTLLLFVVSAFIGAVSKHVRKTGNSHARPSWSASAMTARTHGSPRKPAGVRAHRSSTASFEIVAIDPSGRTDAARQEFTTRPDLSEAAGHLMAGRYVDAKRAYAALATQFPTNSTYTAVSRVLTMKLDSRCAVDKSRSALSCPEIKR